MGCDVCGHRKPQVNSVYSPAKRFFCGPHPLRPGRENFEHLVASGITCFIDLTEPGELPSYQHSEASISHQPATPSKIQYHKFPIRDFSIPSQASMESILDALDEVLSEGHQVYLHCHGGRGRTGTVVGCWLVRHGMTGEQALTRIAELREDNESPETDGQREFVRRWKEGL